MIVTIDWLTNLQAEMIITGTLPVMTIDNEGVIGFGYTWIDERLRECYDRAEVFKQQLILERRKHEEAFFFHLELCDNCTDQLCSEGLYLNAARNRE